MLLAFATPELRDSYLRAHPPVPMTKNTICDAEPLEREFERIRERGYAFDEEEFAVGVSCVAAPIMHNGHVTAALGLSVPTERFKRAGPSSPPARVAAAAR